MNNLIKLLRPTQWIKNTFVFLAMFFGGRLLDASCWGATIIGFVAFCLASSAVYCLNDIVDAEVDRQDPVKRFRPVAAGTVSVRAASALALLLALGSLAVAFVAGSQAMWVIAAYLVLNVAYTLKLKHIALIDVICVALGFVLRLVMGGITADVKLSSWIVIMVFLLAFFLALAKRRHELTMLEKNLKKQGRKSIDGYSRVFIDMSLSIAATVILIAYIIYTVQPDVIERFSTDRLYVTSLFVLCGILRYLQLTVVEENSGDPSKIIYSDRIIQLMVVAWIASFIYIIYA